MNTYQQAAVSSPSGYVQIIAGPGTGKTVTLVGRILEFINRGIEPGSIVAMTFTRAAAKELRERVAKASPSGQESPMIGTFHSVAINLMRRHGELQRLGIKIITEQDTTSILREVAPLQNVASLRKLLRTPQDPDTTSEDEKIALEKYHKRRLALNLYDFDDILVLFHNFMASSTVSTSFGAILVDEFQDTNKIQLQIALKMATSCKNLTVVGDPQQSIYKFRGAVPAVFESMQRMTDNEVNILPLKINYRSTQAILDLAGRIVASQSTSHECPGLTVSLKAAASPVHNTPPEIVRLPSSYSAEGAAISTRIHDLLRIGVKPKDICVLARSTMAFRGLEPILMAKDIKFRTVGGVQALNSGAVSVMIDYIRVALFPQDELALRRSINNPPRRLGLKTLEALFGERIHMDDLRRRSDNPAVQQYVKIIDHVSTLLSKPNIPNQATPKSGQVQSSAQKYSAQELLTDTLPFGPSCVKTALQYLTDNVLSGVDPAVIGAVDIFAEEYETVKSEAVEDISFAEFVVGIWALHPQDYESSSPKDQENKITLSTIHSAKGLEWPCVFVLGCNRSFRKSDDSSEEAKEDRRLFFVALTRAKRSLVVLLNAEEDDTMLNLRSTQRVDTSLARLSRSQARSIASGIDYSIDFRRHSAESIPFADDSVSFQSGLEIHRSSLARAYGPDQPPESYSKLRMDAKLDTKENNLKWPSKVTKRSTKALPRKGQTTLTSFFKGR